MAILIRTLALTLGIGLFGQVAAQDKPYSEGSVWSLTFIKLKPGMFDVYMRDAAHTRREIRMLTAEQLIAAQKANIDTLLSLTNKALEVVGIQHCRGWKGMALPVDIFRRARA